MSTIINATTTNGVVIQPDNSGSLVLQTNSGTTALTIDTAQNATFAGTVTMSSSFLRNRIINGAMVIDQRNAGAEITPTDGQYTLDRWVCFQSQASKYKFQQNAGSVTPPVGFTKYAGITSLSSYSVLSGDYNIFRQIIEGYNVADLGWGTANAKTITISFWVRSSLTGTFGGSLQNSAQDRNYPFTYTISSANTWEQKTVTIAGDTSGTWLTTNGYGIILNFGIGIGSTYSGTAGAWSATTYYSATGATSVVGTSGATWYVTGVQLEIGSTATPFERRLYGQELANCQRYYQAQIIDIGNAAILSGNVTNGVSYYGSKTLQVAMRAAPTLTWGTQWGVNGFAASAPTADWLGADGFRFYKAANSTTNGGYIFQAWNVSAEL